MMIFQDYTFFEMVFDTAITAGVTVIIFQMLTIAFAMCFLGLSFQRAYDNVSFVLTCLLLGTLSIPHVLRLLSPSDPIWTTFLPWERIYLPSTPGVIFCSSTIALELLGGLIDIKLNRLTLTTFAHHFGAIYCCLYTISTSFAAVYAPFYVGLIHFSSACMPSSRYYITNPTRKMICDITFTISFLACRLFLWSYIESRLLLDTSYIKITLGNGIFIGLNLFLSFLQVIWANKIIKRICRLMKA